MPSPFAAGFHLKGDGLMNEIWKIIPGTSGFYAVSNKGRVASKRNRGHIDDSSYIDALDGFHLLHQQKDRYGYLYVRLTVDGIRKQRLVHRIVMLAFVGESDLQVNHINEIKTDNRLENLEYVTNKQNSRYSFQKPIERYDLDTGEVRAKYSSLTAASEDGYNLGDICLACKGKYRHHGGYGWRYCE